MSPERVVIVGTGQGGFQAAASLRQEGFEGAITMIGQEPGLPYQRPPLSKAYLKDGDGAKLALRPASFYEDNDITLVTGTRVERVERAGRQVVTEGGESYAYDHLILATGTRNVTLPIPGVERDCVFGLRTLADARRLRGALARPRHAIVVGGGFIGLEFAAVARLAGQEVTVVEAASRLMARVVSPVLSDRFRQLHEGLGTRLVMGQPVKEILPAPEGGAGGVMLVDGARLGGDMVLLAAGVRPNVELAEAAGLEVANGIKVDALLRTADPAISALGDCAAFPDRRTGRLVRLESVQAATDHARAVARRITGQPAPYDAVPWFWSDQAHWKLQIAGLGDDADDAHLIEAGEDKFVLFRFREGQFIALETVNAAAEHMAARQILHLRPDLTRQELVGREYDLRTIAKEARAGTG